MLVVYSKLTIIYYIHGIHQLMTSLLNATLLFLMLLFLKNNYQYEHF